MLLRLGFLAGFRFALRLGILCRLRFLRRFLLGILRRRLVGRVGSADGFAAGVFPGAGKLLGFLPGGPFLPLLGQRQAESNRAAADRAFGQSVG